MSVCPQVSVVIATYNRARFLAETIESVLRQRFTGYELIVVDDGSTDNTRELLKPYGSRLRYIYQENHGPSAARNVGVRHALAPWISIQDSDDLCLMDHLEILYGYAQEHQDCGMVFANGAYLGEEQNKRQTIIPAKKSQRLAKDGVQLVDLFEKSIVRLQAALISKAAYNAVGGHDESLRICMDLDLSFRLFMNYPVAYMDRIVFQYRKHEGNISRNEELRLLENIRVIDKLVTEFPNARELLGQTNIDRRTAYRYYRLAKGRWRRKEFAAAREAIRGATTLWPYSLKYRLWQLHWGAAVEH
jgi:glycosyltransferase involved in cell wall biosynthesis